MAFKYDSINHAQQDAFDVYQRYLLAGEDLTNNVLKVASAPVVSASYSGTGFTNAGAATKANQKASAGMLQSIRASNANAAVRYLQIHNKASAPAAGETAIFSFVIPAGTAAAPGIVMVDDAFFGLNGYYLSTGVSWAISTTSGTFTDSATAGEHIINGVYL